MKNIPIIIFASLLFMAFVSHPVSSPVKQTSRGTLPAYIDCRMDWRKACARFRTAGTQYYVSNTGSDAANGLSPATAWQTLAKVNTFNFTNNDQVNLQAGGTFYGNIQVHDDDMTYTSYGIGAAPVMTGFRIAAMSSIGGGKYASTVTADSTLNMVLINGQLARHAIGKDNAAPNGGWSTYRSVTKINGAGKNWVCHDTIRGLPVLAPGTHILNKQNDWSILHCVVVSQSHDTTALKFWYKLDIGGSSPSDVSKDQYSWCKYWSTDCINETNEFAYQSGTLTAQLADGSDVVQYSAVDTGINNGAHDGTIISGITLTGYNKFGIYANTADAMLVSGNTIIYIGAEGFAAYRLSNSTVETNTISYCMATGIYIQSVTSAYTNITVQDNVVNNVGKWEGMGSWGLYGDYSACNVTSYSGLYVYRNDISDIGDCVIKWGGSQVEIAYNRILGYCQILQDHGGIYNYWDLSNGGDNNYYRDRWIHDNIIGYGYGYIKGTPATTYRGNPIYMDGINGWCVIENNTLFNYSRSGVNLNMDSNILVRGNIFLPGDSSTFTLARCIGVQQYGVNVAGLLAAGNICFLDYVTQRALAYSVPISTAGIIDSNLVDLYAAAVWAKENSPVTLYTHDGFIATTGQGINDRLIPYVPPDQRRLVSNWSAGAITVTLDGKYIDSYGNTYAGSIILQSWKSALLFYIGSVDPIPPVDPSTGIKIPLRIIPN